MKKAYMVFAAMGLMGFLLTNSHASTAKPRIPASVIKQLDAYIKERIKNDEAENCIRDAQEEMQCREDEIRESRKYCLGDINGDGRNDVAVLFILAGLCCGNSDTTYMAIFIDKGTDYEFAVSQEVGRKGVRYLSFNSIVKGSINLTTQEYAPENPLCCPGLKGKTIYIFENGRLIEKNPTGKNYDVHR